METSFSSHLLQFRTFRAFRLSFNSPNFRHRFQRNFSHNSLSAVEIYFRLTHSVLTDEEINANIISKEQN